MEIFDQPTKQKIEKKNKMKSPIRKTGWGTILKSSNERGQGEKSIFEQGKEKYKKNKKKLHRVH